MSLMTTADDANAGPSDVVVVKRIEIVDLKRRRSVGGAGGGARRHCATGAARRLCRAVYDKKLICFVLFANRQTKSIDCACARRRSSAARRRR